MTLDKTVMATAMLPSQHTGRSLASSRGMALVTVMFLLMILSGLSAAMVTSSQTEIMVARNTVSSAQAQAAAEAGLNHATELAIPFVMEFAANGFANVSDAMTGLVRGPDGLTGSPTSDAENGSLENLGIPRSPAQLALGGPLGAAYEARVFDEDDPARGVTLTAADLARIGEDGDPITDANSTMVIQASGYAPDNTRVTREITITGTNAGNTVTLPALLMGGDLEISGNATFTGSQGGLHVNGDLSISGDANIAGDALAAGSYEESGNPTIGGSSGGGAEVVSISPVAAIDHKPSADFILKSTGQMTDPAGEVICDASSSNDACEQMGYGWVYDPPGWKFNDAGADGTYYVEGPATISGSPGSPGNPIALTIIAEDSIEISGNPNITPDTPELMFVTDGDLKINSDTVMPLTVEGAILVHEQLDIGGEAVLSAQITVEDAVNNSSLVTENKISGSATFSYTGTLGGGGAQLLTRSAWREVR